MTNNIFSALSKYNSAKDENYLTESFVFLLNELLEQDRDVAIEILNNLCVNENDFCFSFDEEIFISTQEKTEQGTPDIKIISPNKLIYIEVKHDSPIGHKQIERYNEALNSSVAEIKHVILLTRFPVDLEGQESPYKHVKWYDVHTWFSKAQVNDFLSRYLVNSFVLFLEEKQMSIQKVGWEYINGVPALINLVGMIRLGIERASLHVHRHVPASDSWGFYIEGKKYLVRNRV